MLYYKPPMNKLNMHLTKLCQNCGLAKPLGYFLSYEERAGVKTYGNICADCRKLKTQEGEASTRSTTGGAGIRNTEKQAQQKQTQDKLQTIKDLYYHTRDEKSTESQVKEEQKITSARHDSLRRDALFNQPNPAAKVNTPPNVMPTQTGDTQSQKRNEAANPSSNLHIPNEVVLKGAAFNQFAAANPNSPIAKALGKNSFAEKVERSKLAGMFKQSLHSLNKMAQEKPEKQNTTPQNTDNKPGRKR